MLKSDPTGKSRTKDDACMRALREIEAQAVAARDAGDFESAIESYRAALELAPLNRNLRDAMGDVLLDAAERRAGKRKSTVAATSRVLVDVPETPAPDARRRSSTTAAAKTKVAAKVEPVRKSRELEFDAADLDDAGFDKEPVRPSRRAAKLFDEPEAPRERRKASPFDMQRPAGPRISPRFAIMACVYAGVLLVGAGLAWGVVSNYLVKPNLPGQDATAEVLPDTLNVSLTRANQFLIDGEASEAIKLLERAAAENPEFEGNVSLAMAQALRAQGGERLGRREYDKAAESYERATRMDPNNEANWLDLARVYAEQGRSMQSKSSSKAKALLQKAGDAYETALKLSPDNPAALVGIGQTYAFLNDRKNAVKYFEKVVDEAPGSPEARIASQNLKQLTGKG